MSHHKIEFDCQCPACKATGLYTGFAEHDGFAVQCILCHGTGTKHEVVEYDDFEGKREKPGVVQVIEVNPGIGLGLAPGLTIASFGGMPYSDWWAGKPFPAKSEMRRFTCPAWWYQSANYDKKPDWKECHGFGLFSTCPSFAHKDTCWERFNRETKR